jgi:plastocyanin
MLNQFRGVAFSATIKWGGAPESTHDFAVYTADITPDNATIFDTCSLSAHSGCLKKSNPVSSASQTASFAFQPTIPADGPPFNGPGVYQYFCQYHPGTMHGTFQIIKNPDLNGNRLVEIQDLATIAFYFGQSTTTASQTADLNNDGTINILDLAQSAFYWADTI